MFAYCARACQVLYDMPLSRVVDTIKKAAAIMRV